MKVLTLLVICTLSGVVGWCLHCGWQEPEHECMVAFRDYMPDPIASQVHLGLEPDGYPYRKFGEEWVRRWLDESAQLLFEVE